MTEGRRSRRAWPTGPTPPAPRQRRTALLFLYALVIGNLLLTVLVFSYVLVLKNARDTEQQRIQQEIVRNNCSLMDALPAGGPLTPLRAIYHCGPGLPTTTP